MGKMNKLLELRATHNRQKILQILMREHIFSEGNGLKPQRFTSRDKDYHQLSDMERYMHMWRKTQSDGSFGLMKLFESADRVHAHDSFRRATDACSPENMSQQGGHEVESESRHHDGQEGSDKLNSESDSKMNPTVLAESLKIQDRVKEKSRLRSERHSQRRQSILAAAQQLRKRERRANAALFALKESEASMACCWQSYLDTGNTLRERKQALAGIERALVASHGLKEEEEDARAAYEESLEASRKYEKILRNAAKVILSTYAKLRQRGKDRERVRRHSSVVLCLFLWGQKIIFCSLWSSRPGFSQIICLFVFFISDDNQIFPVQCPRCATIAIKKRGVVSHHLTPR